MKKRLKSLKLFVSRIAGKFDSADVPHALRALGFILVFIGGNALLPGSGYLACGIFILFYGRPLLKWIK